MSKEFLVENRAGQAFPIEERSEFPTFSSIQDGNKFRMPNVIAQLRAIATAVSHNMTEETYFL
jgi:hypothetical protein